MATLMGRCHGASSFGKKVLRHRNALEYPQNVNGQNHEILQQCRLDKTFNKKALVDQQCQASLRKPFIS